MSSTNVQLGYILTTVGGQAVQAGLSLAPPPLPPPHTHPSILERMDNQQILLHHVSGLQRYTHDTICIAILASRYDTYRDVLFRLEIISNCIHENYTMELSSAMVFTILRVCWKWFTVICLIYLLNLYVKSLFH